MYYKIDEQTLNGILKYLKKRPYYEVVDGIQALENLQPLNNNEQEGE